ncbi:alpha/beta hydrolase [Actinomycetospora chibensis]
MRLPRLRAMKLAVPVFLALLAGLLVIPPASAADTVTPSNPPGSESASGAQCQGYFFPVEVNNKTYKVWGQLCTDDPATLAEQPIQVLIHGGTYNHAYFDWSYQPDRYNYVRYMTQRGFATLNLDRLGYGYSDHPPAVSLNFDVAANTLHQVVQHLRNGSVGTRFTKVVANGYSMGGLTAQVAAARYRDLDAIAVHAVGHGLLTPRSTARLGTLVQPALLDPKFRGQPYALDPGYLTSIPGQRTLFFGPPGTYDEAQLPVEERTKDIVGATELADITLKSYTDLTRNITVPVLWSPGRFDKIWCGTTDDCNTDPMTANEPNFYRPGVFTKYIVQNTGHGTLLGYGGQDYMANIVRWLDAHGIRGAA